MYIYIYNIKMYIYINDYIWHFNIYIYIYICNIYIHIYMHKYIICIHYMCCFSLIGSWWLFSTHHSWDFSNYCRAPCRPSHPRSMDSSASECLRNLMDVTTKKGASLLAFHSHGEFLGWSISKSENWWELIPQVIWKPSALGHFTHGIPLVFQWFSH